RSADAGAQSRIELAGPRRARIDGDGIRARPLHGRAQVTQQRHHRFDIADVGDVFEAAGPVGEQRRGEDRQRGVLVAGGPDRALQRAPAGHRKRRSHECPKLRRGLRRRQAFANVRRVNPVLALALVAAAGIGATRLPLPSLDRPLPRALVRAGVPLLLLGFLLGSGIGMIDPRMLRAVAPVTALAVGWLGARFGARWEWRLVRRVPRTDWGLAGIQAVATLALVAAAALALERVRPALAGAWAPALPAAL